MATARLMTDRILRIKQAKEDMNLSCQDVLDLLEGSGYNLSISTVKRVFAPGSENQPYREDSIYPIEYVLIISRDPVPLEALRKRADAEAYLQQIALQKQVILSKQTALDFYYMRYEEMLQISRMRLIVIYALAFIICVVLFVFLSKVKGG